MSDLLAVVTRNLDDIEDIEEYVAREQGGEGADPTAPAPGRRCLTPRPRRVGHTAAMVARAGDRGRRRRRRPDLRGPPARGRAPRRRGRPRPAAGDDLRRGGRALVPLPRAPAGPGHSPGRARRTPSSTRSPTPTRSAGCGCCPAPRCCREPQPDPWWRAAVPGAGAHPGRARRLDRRLDASRRRSSTCASTSAGSPSRVAELGGTITRLNLGALPAGRAGRELLRASAPGCSARTGPSSRCAARSCTSSRSGSTAGGWTAPGRRTSCRASATSWSAAPTSRASGAARRRRRPPSDILARAPRLVPELRGARVLRHKVGLRPVRPAVRLERVGRRRALLRARRRRRHAELGRRRRGRRPAGPVVAALVTADRDG